MIKKTALNLERKQWEMLKMKGLKLHFALLLFIQVEWIMINRHE